MAFDQAALFLLGTAAVWLSQDQRPQVARYACLCGFAAEPFWFYTSIVHDQWGIVLLSVLYAVAWGRGIWTHWLRPAT